MVFFIVFVVFAVRGSIVFGSGFGSNINISNSVIGQSFYIPNYNLLGDSLRGGYQIFEHIPKGCVSVQREGIIDSFNSYFTDTASFFRSLSTEFSLDVSVNTLGLTLDGTTQSVSGNSRNVSGLTYTRLSKSKQEYLEQSCLHKMDLQQDMLSSFENLPSEIDTPSLPSGWSKYDTFLKLYGSHYVTHVTYGSSLYQHAFSESSASYTEEDYSIKACVALSGTTSTTETEAKVCLGVTDEEKSSASSLNIKTHLVLRGGSKETRTHAYKDHSEESIAQFLGEANVSDDPISYKFTSIWEVLSYKYDSTEHNPKIVNLRSYYQGFLGYPCYNSLPEKTNPTFKGRPGSVFECVIPSSGCQTKDDCGFYDGWGGDWCYCRNNQCVKQMKTESITGEPRMVAYLDSTSWDDSWPGSCQVERYDECQCQQTKAGELVVWTSQNIGFLLSSGNIPHLEPVLYLIPMYLIWYKLIQYALLF